MLLTTAKVRTKEKLQGREVKGSEKEKRRSEKKRERKRG